MGITSTLARPLVAKMLADFAGNDPTATIELSTLGPDESARRKLTEKSADFFVTEGPVPLIGQPDLASRPVVVPVAVGGVAIVYNVSGSAPLRLEPETLVALFAGRITTWGDPRIVETNADAKLADVHVEVVHRSDPSGMTAVFADYASEVSPDWRERVGRGFTIRWPVGREVQGTAGVVAAVKSVAGAIAVVPLPAALEAHLAIAAIKNAAGVFVSPTSASLTAAAKGSVWPPQDQPPSLLRRAEQDAYPLAAFVYVVFDEARLARPRVQGLARFLSWAMTTGQRDAEQLGYGTLPPAIVDAYAKGLRQLADAEWPPPAL